MLAAVLFGRAFPSVKRHLKSFTFLCFFSSTLPFLFHSVVCSHLIERADLKSHDGFTNRDGRS
jgi:hypothetical protein